MPLPNLITAKFTCKLPSDGREITFRPFLVGEEKALLMANESGDPEEQIRAVKESIKACVEGVDISKLPFFDVEYLFLQLRAKSVGEVVKFSYKHRNDTNRAGEHCAASTEVTVNLDEVNIRKNQNHPSSKFMIDAKYGVKMKYPTIDDVKNMVARESDEVVLMAACIEYVYDETDIFPPDNLDDAIRFIRQMNAKQYEMMSKWFETMPTLSHSVTYQCSGCGQEDTVTFAGVSDFF